MNTARPRVANGERATTAAPHIADNGDGVDWTHLRRDMEHRLVTFTRPDSLNDWRAGKLAGLICRELDAIRREAA